MSVTEIVAVLESIDDRAELIAFLSPLRLPTGLPEFERAPDGRADGGGVASLEGKGFRLMAGSARPPRPQIWR